MKLRERYRRLNLWNKLFVWAAIATFLALAISLSSSLVPLIFQPKATVPECGDSSVTVLIPHTVAGEFFNSDRYCIPVSITNKCSHRLFISKIEAAFFNPEVHEFAHIPVGRDGSYYTSSSENPEGGLWLADETKTFCIGGDNGGPQYIPWSLRMRIFHSASALPTTCELTISGKEHTIYWTTPKHIDFSTEKLGIDGLEAYRRALRVAAQWQSISRLAYCMPSRTETTVQDNGLYIHAVEEWAFLMKDSCGDQGIFIYVSEDSVTTSKLFLTTEEPEYADLMRAHLSAPILMGTIDALRRIDEANLIYGNAGIGWWLILNGKTPNGRRPIWRLPYASEDSWALYVDANNGDILSLNLDSLKTNQDADEWLYEVRDRRIP